MFFSCSLHVYIVNFGLLSGGEVMRWRQGLKDGERSFLVSAWSFRERQLQLDWAISGTGPAWAEVVYTKASGVSLKRTWLAMSLSGTNDSFFGKAEWGRLCPDRTRSDSSFFVSHGRPVMLQALARWELVDRVRQDGGVFTWHHVSDSAAGRLWCSTGLPWV